MHRFSDINEIRCTEATLRAFGIQGVCPRYGTGVIDALKTHGYTVTLIELPYSIGLRDFIQQHPTGRYYICTDDHAMALINGRLIDTTERRISNNIKITIAFRVTKNLRESHRFTRFLDEELTAADFRRLRDEGAMFAKNVRRISSGRELAMVAQAYKVWAHHVDHFIYKRLIGMDDQLGGDPLHNETSAQQNLRKKIWPLIIRMGDYFHGEGYINRYTYTRDQLYQGQRLAYVPATAPHWDELYAAFEPKRDWVYRQFSRVFRDAFNALDAYVASKTSFPDRAKLDRLTIDGVTVVVQTSEIQEPSSRYLPNTLAQTQLCLRLIRQVLPKIRARGLGRALRQLEIWVRASYSDLETAGSYASGRSRVDINASGINPHTIAHEIGHHAYYMLSDRQQSTWSQFIRKHVARFTDDDLKILRKAYDTGFQNHKDEKGRSYHVIDKFWEDVVPYYITDKGTRAKYLQFMATTFGQHDRTRLLLPPFVNKTDYEEKWKEFTDQAARGFFAHAPTEYTNKNDNEAYCETFAFYVLDKPLSPLLRAVFEDVNTLR